MRLDGQRLFDPQRAVIVEHGDAVGGGDEIGVARGGHAGDEIKDRLPRRAVSPGRQRRVGGFGVHVTSQLLSSRAAVPKGPSWNMAAPAGANANAGNGSAIMRSR